MKNKLKYFVFFCLITLFSCKKKELNQTDYLQYIEDNNNGLNIYKTMGDVRYTLQYKPLEYIIIKENAVDIKKRTTELEGMQYYTLSYSLENSKEDILQHGLNDKTEYYERVNYLSFGLQNDIYLENGNDKLQCILFNYVRSYGLTAIADFVLAFEKNKSTISERTLVIEDKVFGGGIIKLKIEKNDIENIPLLIAD